LPNGALQAAALRRGLRSSSRERLR